jgi:hypothetical protein
MRKTWGETEEKSSKPWKDLTLTPSSHLAVFFNT